MMRAVVLEEFGGTLTLAEVAKPAAGPGQVLVRVAASGVNPLDTKIAAGTAPGDEVYGLTGGVGGLPGSLAEYAAVDPALLARKPAALTMREAAALPLAVITAWEGLVDRAQVRAGQQVLVHGGAGGVGHMAVQLARARGAEVFATGSAGSLAVIESLGATAIDYATRSPTT